MEERQRLASLVVECFLRSKERLAIAERLILFQDEIHSPLEGVLSGDYDVEAKSHAAVVLLETGSRAGVPSLLNILKEKQEFAGFAAIQLAKAGVSEARPLIHSLLASWDFRKNPHDGLGLIAAMQKYGPLPQDIWLKLREAYPPHYLKCIREDDERAKSEGGAG